MGMEFEGRSVLKEEIQKKKEFLDREGMPLVLVVSIYFSQLSFPQLLSPPRNHSRKGTNGTC